MRTATSSRIAYHFVMRRTGSERAYARQRALLQELVAALTLGAPDSLEPHFRPSWHAGPDDGARLRVVVDQVASLTDVSVLDWHRRLVR